ncbi:Piso0_001258 [Millerozyma farinosa CBS 7064]|uniref:Piso0_001258 protein n=1 Tax=Pichia sorbitophila (strain ATCC MYA-4447 / BCRC 22081 / CBS 7064 / NBRC 10061 / NRRL Y-12695) TaxID=559304 RepID=G8YMP0_PICSO|nr:Piso0_001258 [Millerozyma farinosa CBS 7064]
MSIGQSTEVPINLDSSYLSSIKVLKTREGRESEGGDSNGYHIGGRSRDSSHKIPKDMNKLNLGGGQTQIPPNTGPPGTVPVNGSSGSNSNGNKNLSHVPCKFYKQGICQAGDSCPFSHHLDGMLAADKLPCKYFQRGNCKFGLKCALAHFLPDGTRVNSQSFANSFGNKNTAGSKRISEGNSLSLQTPQNTLSSKPIEISPTGDPYTPRMSSGLSPSNSYSNFMSWGTMLSPQRHSQSSKVAATGSNYDYSAMNHNKGSAPASILNPSGNYGFLRSNQLSFANNSLGSISRSHSIHTPQSGLSSSGLHSSPLPNSPGNTSASSIRMSNSFTRAPTAQSSFSSPTSYLNSQQLNCSAIADDESEDDNSGFFEDYVPGSLGDLILTPQEMQRRDSRSQSGTLLVRPRLRSSSSHSTDAKKGEEDSSGNDNVPQEGKVDDEVAAAQEDAFFLMD